MPRGCSDRNGAKEDIAKNSPEKIKKTEVDCPPKKKYRIIDLTLWVDAPDDKLMMNDPDRKVEVRAILTYIKTNDPNDLDSLPTHIKFSFGDPSLDNTTHSDSYEYQAGKFLGKKGDPSAKFWEAHPEHSASSDDGYKQTCKVSLKTLEADKKEIAKVYFKSSGVGGDDYKLRAAALSSDGTSEIISKESNTLTVWRSVTFNRIYEMQGETHVSANAATATISPVFDPAFVQYTAGTRNEIPADKNVKYIGLWKDTTTPQEDWATIQQKKADEIPTEDEKRDATSAGADPVTIAKRNTARANIIAKAQKWTDRIDAAFGAARDKWISDAGIPGNAIVGIRYYHPKYSYEAGDYQTNEWNLGGASTPAWLRVGAFPKGGGDHYYTNLDPDGLWAGWVGLSHGNGIVTIPKGRPAADVTQTIRHEAGHATSSSFKRDIFGPDLDHSASNRGIMYYSSALGGTTFSDREKKMLKGIKR